MSTKLRQDCYTVEHMYLKFIFTQMVPCCLFSYFSEKNLLLYLFFLSSVLWNPSGDGSQVVTVCEQHLDLWDLDRSASTAEVFQ